MTRPRRFFRPCRSWASLLAVALCLPWSASAQPPHIVDSPVTTLREQTHVVTRVQPEHAEHWGLEQEEWQRYLILMEGPLGVYSPHLDPLTALGIEARTDEERRRYAELQVQVEAARVEKLLAYQRAYDAAWQRLYPTLLRVELAHQAPVDRHSLSGSQRFAVFVRENCPACEERVTKLLTHNAAFDLYLVDSDGNDTRIRRWAAQVGVDPARVRDRRITLNHDAGRWASLALTGGLPAVVRQVDGQWQRF